MKGLGENKRLLKTTKKIKLWLLNEWDTQRKNMSQLIAKVIKHILCDSTGEDSWKTCLAPSGPHPSRLFPLLIFLCTFCHKKSHPPHPPVSILLPEATATCQQALLESLLPRVLVGAQPLQNAYQLWKISNITSFCRGLGFPQTEKVK